MRKPSDHKSAKAGSAKADLAKLVARISKANRHPETDWGTDVGREAAYLETESETLDKRDFARSGARFREFVAMLENPSKENR